VTIGLTVSSECVVVRLWSLSGQRR